MQTDVFILREEGTKNMRVLKQLLQVTHEWLMAWYVYMYNVFWHSILCFMTSYNGDILQLSEGMTSTQCFTASFYGGKIFIH